MKFFSMILGLCTLFVLSSLSCSDAASMRSSSRLLASDSDRYNRFGSSVDISPDGMSALVGADQVSRSGDPGAAYLFSTLSSAGEKITSGSASSEGDFGKSVALSDDGTTAIIGAPWTTIGSNIVQGAAYIFINDGGWVLEEVLVAPDGTEWSHFGNSVDISDNGNTVIVGSHGVYEGHGQGAAYVYVRNGFDWNLQQKLVAADGQQLDFFGLSVALSGDGNTALVGSPFDTNNFSDEGSAYVFVWTGTVWSQQYKLFAGWQDGYFGHAVDLSDDGNTALIGAYGTDSAYIFRRSGTVWNLESQLTAQGGSAFDWFGHSVALSNNGNIAVVGAIFAEAAYLFTRQSGSWVQQEKLTTSDPDAGGLGSSVAVSDDGRTVLVGAEDTTVSGVESQRAVYVFKLFVPLTGPNILLLGKS